MNGWGLRVGLTSGFQGAPPTPCRSSRRSRGPDVFGDGGRGTEGGGWGVPPSCRRCGVGPAASSAEAGKGKVLNSARSRARKRGGGFGTAGTCRAHPNRERRGQVCGDGTERGGGGAERGPRERSQERQECGSARTGLKTEAADAGRRRGEGEAGGSRVGTERTPHRAAEPKAVGNAGQRDGGAPCVLRSLGGPPSPQFSPSWDASHRPRLPELRGAQPRSPAAAPPFRPRSGAPRTRTIPVPLPSHPPLRGPERRSDRSGEGWEGWEGCERSRGCGGGVRVCSS